MMAVAEVAAHTQSSAHVHTDSPDHHQLQSEFSLWVTRRKRRGPGVPPPSDVTLKSVTAEYDQNLKLVDTFPTVERFWSVFSYLRRPGDFPASELQENGWVSYHLFRSGIKPMWEDPANSQGGKWTVRLRKGAASRMWEKLCMAVVGDQLGVGDDLCGAIISIRHNDDIISVWNKSATKRETNQRLRANIRRVLNLPAHAQLDYKAHDDSMRHLSNYTAGSHTKVQ